MFNFIFNFIFSVLIKSCLYLYNIYFLHYSSRCIDWLISLHYPGWTSLHI